jgi:hypothetical protein
MYIRCQMQSLPHIHAAFKERFNHGDANSNRTVNARLRSGTGSFL